MFTFLLFNMNRFQTELQEKRTIKVINNTSKTYATIKKNQYNQWGWNRELACDPLSFVHLHLTVSFITLIIGNNRIKWRTHFTQIYNPTYTISQRGKQQCKQGLWFMFVSAVDLLLRGSYLYYSFWVGILVDYLYLPIKTYILRIYAYISYEMLEDRVEWHSILVMELQIWEHWCIKRWQWWQVQNFVQDNSLSRWQFDQDNAWIQMARYLVLSKIWYVDIFCGFLKWLSDT